MSKYSLVASYYDQYEKTNQKYKNEIEINIPGVDLSTIQAIDFFTSSHTKSEIFTLLEQTIGLTERNHLAIKYQKRKTEDSDYFKVIYNHPDFASCTKDNTSKTYQIDEKYISTKLIQNHNDLFQLEKRKLLQLLEARDVSKFQEYYPYQDDFSYLVNRYFNSSYDTEYDNQRDLNLILLEFSRYTTFRKWIIAQEKNKKGFRESSYYSIKKPISSIPTAKSSSASVRSVEEYEQEYQKKFESAYHIPYETYQTTQYNTSHLEEDKEEFLETEEIEQLHSCYLRKKNHR